MMGSRRWSGPRRTNILSSLVWLSRGPWIFRSCLPRTTISSNVCLPEDRRKTTLWVSAAEKQKSWIICQLDCLLWNKFSLKKKLHRKKKKAIQIQYTFYHASQQYVKFRKQNYKGITYQTYLMTPNDFELTLQKPTIFKANMCALLSVLGAISPEEIAARSYTTPTMFSWPVLCGSSWSRAWDQRSQRQLTAQHN